jgi:uncharacterized protein (DUF427 family)
MWKYTGRSRPPFAQSPSAAQESVWDYPRPPKLVADTRRVVVRSGDLVIAESVESWRVLETAGPPTFYIPPKDTHAELLQPFPGASICEWKGAAKYWSLKTAAPAREAVAWSYPLARPPYALVCR